MPIEDFNEGIPKGRAKATGEGRPPSPMRILPALLRQWVDDLGDDNRPMSIANRDYRASWANNRCDRQLAYAITGAEQTDPPTTAGRWRMNDGKIIHTTLQGVSTNWLEKVGAVAIDHEVPVDLRAFGLNGAASSDSIIDWYDEERSPSGAIRSVVEYKSVGGFKFKKMTTPFDGPPEGAEQAHVIQGALAATALAESDGVPTDLCVAYIATESVSKGLAAKWHLDDLAKFTAEYWFSAEDCELIANREAARVEDVMSALEHANADAIPRLMHDDKMMPGAIVTNPIQGRVDLIVKGDVTWSDTTWRCQYCSWQQRCAKAG